MDETVTDPTTELPTGAVAFLKGIAERCVGLDAATGIWHAAVRAATEAGYRSAVGVLPNGDAVAVEGVVHEDPVVAALGDLVGPALTVETLAVDDRTVVRIPVVAAAETLGSLFVEVPDPEVPVEAATLQAAGSFLADRLAAAQFGVGEEDEVATQRRAIRKLHSVATRMVGTESAEGVYQLAIDAAENILRLDSCTIDVVRDGYFVPVATSSGVAESTSERVPADRGIAGRTYAEGRTFVLTDIQADEDAHPVDESYRGLLSVPIGDIGVFQAVSRDPDAFTERDASLAELLMTYVSQTLSRIRSEAALRESEAKYRTLVEGSHEAVLIVQDGTVAFANDRAAELAGTDRAALPSIDPFSLAHLEDRDRVIEVGAGVLDGEGPVTFDARIRPVDGGGVRHCEISLTPITYDGDEAVMATVHDITERREYERALERQNERLDEFASVVSHDLRNPLNVASGRASLAIETGDVDHLDPAAAALDRMGELIERALELARTGRQVEETATVPLDRLATDAWSTVDTADATLVLETDGAMVEADEARLRQLFENLFRNVIDHAGTDATVTVRTTDDGFTVTDDGPGIPDDAHEAVFERGYSSAANGTGFGLAIVRNIVEAHGWTIESVPHDGGARFVVGDVHLR